MTRRNEIDEIIQFSVIVWHNRACHADDRTVREITKVSQAFVGLGLVILAHKTSKQVDELVSNNIDYLPITDQCLTLYA